MKKSMKKSRKKSRKASRKKSRKKSSKKSRKKSSKKSRKYKFKMYWNIPYWSTGVGGGVSKEEALARNKLAADETLQKDLDWADEYKEKAHRKKTTSVNQAYREFESKKSRDLERKKNNDLAIQRSARQKENKKSKSKRKRGHHPGTPKTMHYAPKASQPSHHSQPSPMKKTKRQETFQNVYDTKLDIEAGRVRTEAKRKKVADEAEQAKRATEQAKREEQTKRTKEQPKRKEKKKRSKEER